MGRKKKNQHAEQKSNLNESSEIPQSMTGVSEPEIVIIEPVINLDKEDSVVKESLVEKKLPVEEPVKLFSYHGEFEHEYFADIKAKGCDYRIKGNWQRMYARYIDKLFDLKGKMLLDVGCAYGANTSAFIDLGATAIGLDISSHASKHTPFKDFPFLNEPSWDIKSLEDTSVDFIHVMYVLNNMNKDKLEKTFQEFQRIGKNNCIIFIIMNLSDEEKQINETSFNYSKLTVDQFAKDNAMKNGTNSIQEKLKIHEPDWNFIEMYKWHVLVYKVCKE